MRVLRTVVVVTIAVLSSACPAAAITSGQPDETRHPYVGLMQTYDANDVPLQVCTGSLLSPTTFLTAGHCVAEPHATHAQVWFDKGPILPDVYYLIALFFDPSFDGSCNHVPAFHGYPCNGGAWGTPHAHPDFCFDCAPGAPNTVNRDVAVVTLDDPVPTSVVARYAELPVPGRIDSLGNQTRADLVGYGVSFQQKLPGKYFTGPPPGARWTGSGERRYAPAELVAANFANSDEFVRLSLNAAGGTGGLCFGDSGGPDLLGGTDTVLAVNSYVMNYNCSGVGYSQRVDIPEVLGWIRGFMGPR
jgi:hypothetical protein